MISSNFYDSVRYLEENAHSHGVNSACVVVRGVRVLLTFFGILHIQQRLSSSTAIDKILRIAQPRRVSPLNQKMLL